MPVTQTSSPDLPGQMSIVPLDRERHAGLGVDTNKVNQYLQSLNTVYLNVVEFFYANKHYPVAFVKDGQQGFVPCAVTGIEQGRNLFISSGGWEKGAYIPAQSRMYPVFVSAEKSGEEKSNDEKRVVLVDENALVESAEPFFTKLSAPTEKWKLTEKFVSDYISAEKLTRQFTAKLVSLNLLEAFDAQINPSKDSPKRLTGLYRVSEDKLNRLSAKDIKQLMKGGELSRIYAHLISLENFSGLLDRSVSASMQSKQ